MIGVKVTEVPSPYHYHFPQDIGNKQHVMERDRVTMQIKRVQTNNCHVVRHAES